MLREDEGYQQAVSKYVYVHLFRDKDGEAYQVWSKRVKAPVHAIPQVNIVKSDGKLVFSQSGGFKDLRQTLVFKAMELSGDKGAAELVAEFRTALKDADGLVGEGKFLSAYERMTDFPEGMTLDDKTKSLSRATFKRIETAALAKIGEAKKLLEEGDTEAKKLDGLYQLMMIRGGFKRVESIRAKAHAPIVAFGSESQNSNLSKQAVLLSNAREAVRNDDVETAKKHYQKLLTDHKDSEAAKRAKARLQELDRE